MKLFAALPDGTADPILTELAKEDKVKWYKKPNLRKMYVFLFLCCMGVEITSGFDSQLINTLQFTPSFLRYFGGGRLNAKGEPMIEDGMLGFVNSCYQLGSIFGVPLAPWVAKKYGRRWSIMIGSWIMVVGALMQGWAQHVGMYIVARMLLGVGILFCIISGAAMIGELAGPKERPIMTSLFNSSWFLGAIIASALSLKFAGSQSQWGWRIPSLLQICPSLLQICTVFFLPESPRWLITKDRDEEAFNILVKYHAEGDRNSVFVKAEMAQIRETVKMEEELSKQSWLDLLATPGMRRRTLVTIFLGIFTQMSGNTLLGFYSGLLFGMMGFTKSLVKAQLNLANHCWGLLNSTFFALIVTRFRRRYMFMLSAASMCAVFTAMTVSFWALQQADKAKVKNPPAQITALVMYYAYGPCYNLGNNALTYTYLVELWPYNVRSRGIAAQQFFGKLAGFFSTNVNPKALNSIGWKYFAVYCAWIAFEFGFIYLFYPETYNRTLEELTFLFEDKAYADKATVAVEKQIHYGDGDPADRDAGVVQIEEQQAPPPKKNELV